MQPLERRVVNFYDKALLEVAKAGNRYGVVLYTSGSVADGYFDVSLSYPDTFGLDFIKDICLDEDDVKKQYKSNVYEDWYNNGRHLAFDDIIHDHGSAEGYYAFCSFKNKSNYKFYFGCRWYNAASPYTSVALKMEVSKGGSPVYSIIKAYPGNWITDYDYREDGKASALEEYDVVFNLPLESFSVEMFKVLKS